ncbi:NANS [Cordylochernes scorpioides]|uniref:NANS n=1 Tax=Cordylochernes scorpioides TaxID=51811 RepID=A0ABY6KXT6_9ARAC|nr:NANS [Cordylochernes scorpioides]
MMAATFKITPNHRVGGDNPCFIIAEIGQNHQGCFETAKKLIKAAKECGADCAKFQKTNLPSRFNRAALNRPYLSANSFGPTYGEHRQYLEFSNEEFRQLQKYTNEIGIIFSASGMDKPSVDFLHQLDVPFLKLGSGDSTNWELQAYTASLGRPVVASTGMQDWSSTCHMYNLLSGLTTNLALLHCVSAYPTPPAECRISLIPVYRREFPKAVIGYSGHEEGFTVTLAAVALGAKIVERHMTLDHHQKGSDHKSSLEPAQFKQMVEQIRQIEAALGTPHKELLPCEMPTFLKLGKSLVTTRSLSAGSVLEADHLCAKVAEPPGLPAQDISRVIGATITRDLAEDESLQQSDISHLSNGLKSLH